MSMMRNRGTGFAQRGQLDGVILWMPPVSKMHKGGPLMAFVRASRHCNSRVFAFRHLLAVAVAGIRAEGEVETGKEYGIFQAH
jgi:hypothetical protein